MSRATKKLILITICALCAGYLVAAIAGLVSDVEAKEDCKRRDDCAEYIQTKGHTHTPWGIPEEHPTIVSICLVTGALLVASAHVK